MKISVEMAEEEFKEYLKVKSYIKGKRETKEILDLDERLQRLSKFVYDALQREDNICGGIQIINDNYAKAALALAEKELF